MKRVSLAEAARGRVSHNAAIAKRTLLHAGDLPALTGFAQAEFPPGEEASAHRHEDMAEVFFVQRGVGEIVVEGICFPLRPGDCVLVEPGESHLLRNSGEEPLLLLYFGVETGRGSSEM